MKFQTLLLTLGLLLLGVFAASAQFTPWHDVNLPADVEPVIAPARFRAVEVDVPGLRSWLSGVPGHGYSATESRSVLAFPLPDGEVREYRVVEERVMAPELQARFPLIRTYTGVAVDGGGGTVHFDVTERGFHAMLLAPGGETTYIDPVDRDGSSGWCVVYSRAAFFAASEKVRTGCEVHGEQEGPGLLRMGLDVRAPKGERTVAAAAAAPNGAQLRTYRLALACTGEYAQYHGGTVAGALSAMATSMVRINGVYHRDVAIHMELIANNDAIIYLNGATDPYTNNDGGAMLSQNQTTCDNVIGSANYDIGHVFSTGGGGVAYLQSPCSSFKAGGVTGGGNPVGDPFDIDYVCHEMGHQFGANHTQNNPCNRSAGAAFEPGSASTIMGYAGICSPNLQSNSDDHFHVHSINEMIAFSVNGSGNSCAVVTASGNTPPTVTVGPSGKFIPRSTPFELTAVGADPDGEAALTYNWEQYDLGPATASGDNNLTNPSGTQPILRSWPSSTSATRVFPRIPDLVSGGSTIGELLPGYGRDMTFRCTVRDNQLTGGVEDAELSFAVDGNSGPFVLNSPNGGNSVEAGVPTPINWAVAGTDAAPVNCTAVDVWLSTDGGFTWPYLVASELPNDGSASIVLPNVPTANARLKVKAADNYFFDISNGNFTITPAADPVAYDARLTEVSGADGDVCGEAVTPSVTVVNWGSNALTALAVTFSVDGGAAETTVNWTGNLAYLGSVEISAGEALAAPAGAHTLDASVVVIGAEDEDASNNAASTAFTTGCFDGCSGCGCTDAAACNYDPAAALDDGSCTFPVPGVGCDCFEEGAVAAILSGGESAAVALEVGGDLETIEATFAFTSTGSSWPGDLVIGVCDPGGNCLEIGGYNVDLGYTEAGNWPTDWNVVASGTYTATVDVSGLGLTGSGTWAVTVMNGWNESGTVPYDVAFVLDGVCALVPVPGCTDEAACNYDATATANDGSCTYAEPFLDCAGECLNDTDGDGVCDGLEIAGCTDPEGCDYNAAATDSVPCTYATAGFDCAGNPLSCPEDLNGNGLVEIQDVLMLLGDFGCTAPPCAGDLNGDGITTVADMLALLGAFGTSCW